MKEIMSDITKILAEDQREMKKLIAPTSRAQNIPQNKESNDSETEIVLSKITSTTIKTKTSSRKGTPITSRNNCLSKCTIRKRSLNFPRPWMRLCLSFPPISILVT